MLTRKEVDEILRAGSPIVNDSHARQYSAHLREALKRYDALVQKKKKEEAWADVQREAASLLLDVQDPRFKSAVEGR